MRVCLLLILSLWPSVAPAAQAAPGITLNAEDDWWPYSAPRNGVPSGFAVDIVKAAMASVSVKLTLKSLPFSRCVKLVREGAELGCFNMLKDETTIKDFRFPSQPIFDGVVAIYARSDFVGAATVSTLEGKTIGITNGYTYGPEIENNPRIKRDLVNFDVLNLKKLVLKRIDFALLDTRVAAYLIHDNWGELGGKVKQVGVALPAPLFVFFSKVRPDATQAIKWLDEGLSKIKSNGTYAEIEAKWSLSWQHNVSIDGVDSAAVNTSNLDVLN